MNALFRVNFNQVVRIKECIFFNLMIRFGPRQCSSSHSNRCCSDYSRTRQLSRNCSNCRRIAQRAALLYPVIVTRGKSPEPPTRVVCKIRPRQRPSSQSNRRRSEHSRTRQPSRNGSNCRRIAQRKLHLHQTIVHRRSKLMHFRLQLLEAERCP